MSGFFNRIRSAASYIPGLGGLAPAAAAPAPAANRRNANAAAEAPIAAAAAHAPAPVAAAAAAAPAPAPVPTLAQRMAALRAQQNANREKGRTTEAQKYARLEGTGQSAYHRGYYRGYEANASFYNAARPERNLGGFYVRPNAASEIAKAKASAKPNENHIGGSRRQRKNHRGQSACTRRRNSQRRNMRRSRRSRRTNRR